MAGKKQVAKAPGGRQAAYTARNRAALIKAGQQVLAEIGPQATIEQLVEYAQVSPTTIYKYFENKESLFAEAFNQSWEEWIEWSNQFETSGDRLERVLDTGRKLFWVKQHNPLFAKILHNTLQEPALATRAVLVEGSRVFKELAKAGDLKIEDFDKRILLWANIYGGILTGIYVSGSLSPAEANTAFGIGLSVWGISEAKAKKLVARPLNFNA
jgi:AcrR family transcriptional regulator